MSVLTYRGRAGFVVVALMLGACSSPSSPVTTSPQAATTGAEGAPSAARAHEATKSADPLSPPANRCGPPEDPAAREVALHGPGGSVLPAVDVGHGKTFAVLIHQTDGDGLCGFWPYADWLATKHDVHALLFDLCDFGRAKCPDGRFSGNQQAQVALAVQWARQHGARRVVLVGASMGGALALSTAALTTVDAVVDLSGPPTWPGAVASEAVAKINVPVLIATSPNDPYADYHQIHAAFDQITARPKRFIKGSGAHGWGLLSGFSASPNRIPWLPLATTVARWILGTKA
jgi:predicted alpha/beta-hydrolase family hydrolase